MALPPPIAIIASWFPSLNLLTPFETSSSLGFGDISKNKSDFTSELFK
jgi:hypothetical protein